MRVRRIILGVALGVAVSGGLYVLNRYWITPATAYKPKCPSVHPMAADFALTSLVGNPVNLKDYRGRVVLLNFWATWCTPCRREVPGLVNLQRKYGLKGLRVIGMDVISEDNAEAVREFNQQFKMNYPVVLASDKVGDLYGGLVGTPTSVLIGCDGRIYGKYVGYIDPNTLARKIRGLLTACSSG